MSTLVWFRDDLRLADHPALAAASRARDGIVALYVLDEGVAQSPMDLDLAMITGTGFAFWNGGITPLLDRTGIAERVTGSRFLPPGAASVPAA